MDTLDNEAQSSPQFTPLRQQPHNSNQQTPPVIIRKSRSRVARPHSIGATIISNPKLVKGWQYYDNSPQPKSYRKYLSSINLPSEEVDSDYSSNGTGGRSKKRIVHEGVTQSSSHLNRDSYRKGVGRFEEEDDDYVAGVEVQACVASDDDEVDDEDEASGNKGWCKQLLRIILTLVASSAVALSTVLVKISLEKDYNPYSISIWMFQGALLPSMVLYLVCKCFSLCQSRGNKSRKERTYLSIITKESEKSKYVTWTLVIVGALFGWIGVVLKIYSLEFISVVTSTAVTFTAPLFIVICSGFYLKERIGKFAILAASIILVAVGVIMVTPYITRGKEFNKNELTGILLALGCMLIIIKTVIIFRYIRQVHYSLLTFTFGLVGTVCSLLLCFIHPGKGFQFPKGANDWFIASALAALTFVEQNLMTYVLKWEEAGSFSVIRAWEIPMVFLWQLLLAQGRPCLLHSLVGAALVVLAVLIGIVRKFIQR